MAPKCLDMAHLNGFLLLIKEAQKCGILEKYVIFLHIYKVRNIPNIVLVFGSYFHTVKETESVPILLLL